MKIKSAENKIHITYEFINPNAGNLSGILGRLFGQALLRNKIKVFETSLLLGANSLDCMKK